MRTLAGDFYEDDEPVEQVRDAFEDGEHGVTKPVGITVTQDLTQVIVAGNRLSGED